MIGLGLMLLALRLVTVSTEVLTQSPAVKAQFASVGSDLLEEKARFHDLQRAYATTHLGRLSANTMQSLETSSLHIDLMSDLKRINSHICSISYPILDSAGALAPNRLRQSALAED